MINSIMIPVGVGVGITALAYGLMVLFVKAYEGAGNRAKRRRLLKLYENKGRKK